MTALAGPVGTHVEIPNAVVLPDDVIVIAVVIVFGHLK